MVDSDADTVKKTCILNIETDAQVEAWTEGRSEPTKLSCCVNCRHSSKYATTPASSCFLPSHPKPGVRRRQERRHHQEILRHRCRSQCIRTATSQAVFSRSFGREVPTAISPPLSPPPLSPFPPAPPKKRKTWTKSLTSSSCLTLSISLHLHVPSPTPTPFNYPPPSSLYR